MSSTVTVFNNVLKGNANINEPLFQCYDAGVRINDGNIADDVSGTVNEGTIVSFSSSVYLSGSHEYETTITAPQGYRNEGQNIVCSGSFATGEYGTPITNSIYLSIVTNNTHNNYCNNVGANFNDINQYNQISPGLQRNVSISSLRIGDRIIGTGNWTSYGSRTAHVYNDVTLTFSTSAYPDPNYPDDNFTTLTVTNVQFC
jgi:hypothetical protein